MVSFTESDEDMQLLSAGFAVLIVEIPRNIGHHDAPVALEIEQSLESGCTLVMQQIVIPAVLDQFGNNDGDDLPGIVLFELQHMIENRRDDEAVRRLEYHEFGRLQSGLKNGLHYETIPVLAQVDGFLATVDVHGPNVFGE